MNIKVWVEVGDSLPYASSFSPDLFEIVGLPEEADIICLSGGADIHPVLYGEEVTPECGTLDEFRDLFNVYLYNKYKGVKPLVGICRGMQFLAAMHGCTLHQHDVLHAAVHQHTVNGHMVPSCHHQVVLPPPWFDEVAEIITVTTVNDVEALVAKDHTWMGTQWHPYACRLKQDNWGFSWFNEQVIKLHHHFNNLHTQQ